MIRVVSLFAGIGGADRGLYAAARSLGIDVEVVAAYELDPKAVEIYNANMPHASAVVADVKKMTRADLPPHDLVIGGPPCQDHSVAGLRRCQCHLGGYVAPRCCLADFLRLAGDSPWLMENVASRLIKAPFSVKLNAFDFGDVTTRKRWFYSNYLLHVIETPGPRRFGDIRDHEADRIALAKRGAVPVERKKGDTRGGRSDDGAKISTYADADALSSLTAHAWHGHDVRSAAKLVGVARDDEALGSLTQSSFHGHKNNGCGNPTERAMVELRNNGGARIAADDAAILGSVTADSWHGKGMGGTSMVAVAGQSRPTQDDDALGTLTGGKGGSSGFLKVGLRGHSASAFEDEEPIGSLIANSWHGNKISKLGPSVRCPSFLEMQRAHSFPDDFDWCAATKTQRGRFIANSWPVGMATAVCRAMLVALG